MGAKKAASEARGAAGSYRRRDRYRRLCWFSVVSVNGWLLVYDALPQQVHTGVHIPTPFGPSTENNGSVGLHSRRIQERQWR
ncbi:hypothetical protein [Halocatena pleomorpha]|uniref:Uncharacterized protein n=1 Tax=Halocatena pleomorpha TaxID=1785090 RepID=A0A3P3RC63_9EURY|nr:hypothetical protein [Halocatena pleomorpha]RRJ30985.1 hypothetical protein EIK79_08205 [Halocatena pleomorpha]